SQPNSNAEVGPSSSPSLGRGQRDHKFAALVGPDASELAATIRSLPAGDLAPLSAALGSIPPRSSDTDRPTRLA
ncbi:MAG: hypothetical protein AAFO29_21315, partial [Actinomycetota bacterium]